MQDLALAMSEGGREEILNLSQVAIERMHILEEVVQELRLRHVRVQKKNCENGLLVYCPRFGLERILDHLFGNAARAVPLGGGVVSVQCYQQGDKACVSIENSGEIAKETVEEINKGAVKGRGLNITTRFVHANHGDLKIETHDGVTRFIIALPMAIKYEKKN